VTEPESPAPPRSTTRARAKVVIKLILTALVVVAVARHAMKTWDDLRSKGESIQIAPGPFAVAVVVYVLALVPFGVFYWRLMAASPTPIGPYPSIRAYFISHLGKYVPGKALVVVMRAGLSAPHGARVATAAIASFYETLLMMGVGGLLAAALGGLTTRMAIHLPLGSNVELDVPLFAIGIAVGGMFAVMVLPRVFSKLTRWATGPFPRVGPDALPRIDRWLYIEGICLATLGWMLLGLSQVAVLVSILPEGLPLSAWSTAIASVALATVAGFVIPISPGGLGIREWVLWTALASVIERDHAVVAALLLRLAWVIGEVLAAAVLFAIRPASRPAAT
jgi:uncharacterized membrane protein YbhN (UPF0104 family)